MAKEIQFIIYNLPDGAGTVPAIVRDETIYLTQKAMAELLRKQLFEKFEQFRMKVLVVLREKEYITLSMLLSV